MYSSRGSGGHTLNQQNQRQRNKRLRRRPMYSDPAAYSHPHHVNPQPNRHSPNANDASTSSLLPKQEPEGLPKLSNTQLKRQRVREWRRRQRENELPDAASSSSNSFTSHCHLFKSSQSPGVTKQIAIDCEMVGAGPRGCRDVLARVSIVSLYGEVLYDKYVLPHEPVTDFRTFVSGIYPHHLEAGIPFETVQKEVCDLLKDRVIVGHAIKHDLRVLYLEHPTSDIRDTSLYFDAAVYGGRGTPSLRKLTEHFVGINIQSCAHDSVEDARATMRLYCMFMKDWEAKLAAGRRSGS